MIAPMYKVNAEDKQLIPLTPKSFGDLGVMERFDIQEWIEKTPSILGQELLVIAKELPLPSGIRLDLLAIDKQANLVIIELKRGESGRDVEWQAIKYASYCSNFLPDEIFTYYAQYLQSDIDEAQLSIEEFIDEELDNINQSQQIILVADEFHPDVVSAVLWLRDYGVVEFETGGALGEMKDNYRVVLEHQELLSRLVEEWNRSHIKADNLNSRQDAAQPALGATRSLETAGLTGVR